MCRASKVWVVIGGFLVLLGLVLFTVVMTANRWDFTRLSTSQFETNTYTVDRAFHSIAVDTDTADIRVLPSEDRSCQVVCYEWGTAVHRVEVLDSILTITQTDDREWYDYIGINIGEPTVTVYLPEGEYTALSVRESTGDVEISRNFSFSHMEITAVTGDVYNAASSSGEVKIKTDTGDIRVEAIEVGTLELSVSTGQITAASVYCAGELKLQVSTGEAELTDVECGSLASAGSTGDIFLQNVIASETLSVERSTGDIRLEGCDAAELLLKTSTGDVTGTLLTEKVFTAATSVGDVEVPETLHGGKCEITTDTGDIRIGIG